MQQQVKPKINSSGNESLKSRKESLIKMETVSSFALGILFGFLMNKANIVIAPTIRDQMLFKRLTMLKMFLSAVGMSMLSVCLILIINPKIYQKTLNGFIQRNKSINIVQLAIGGSLIGIGMVLSGSCPGTVFVQIGSGLRNSILTSVGGCFGVLFYYSFVHKYLSKTVLDKSSVELQQLSSYFGVKQIILNLFLGILFVSISFTIDYLFPDENRSIAVQTWSPSLCGLGIGGLQLFFILIFEKSLGISTGFTVLVAQLCRIRSFKRLFPSLESFQSGLSNLITILFSIGAVLGSFLCSYSSNDFPLDNKYGADFWPSLFGGFFLLVGARCAGGCTSGQGISGVSHLLIGSFLATAAMFAGGIAFAFSYVILTNDWHFYNL